MENKERDAGALLRNAAAQLREELGELRLFSQKAAPSERRRLSPRADKDAAFADRNRLRMARLAENMETCAELMRGGRLERQNVDIVGMIAEICEESADLAEYLGVKLEFSCAEDKHICAVHAEYVRRLAYHLLSNALKVSPSGGRVRVRVAFLRPAYRLLLSVQDEGRGIEADGLSALFDGVGLGLFLCKRIAEGHGGFITVRSEPGKGSEFTLNIPEERENTLGFRQGGDFHVADGGVHPALLRLSDALPVEAFRIANQL